MSTKEIWKTILEFESYEISNLGNVRSYKRGIQPRNIKPGITRNGYLFVILADNGKIKHKRIHQLVASAFIGPQEPGMFVLHNDDDKANNQSTNLRYGTPKDNTADMIKNNGYRHPLTKGNIPRRKITQQNIIAKQQQTQLIKKLRFEDRLTYIQIAKMVGLSTSAICRIVKGNRR